MKDKKIRIVLFILIIIAGIYYFSNSKGSLSLRNSSFAIDSPEDITKIVISVKDKDLILEKESDHWKVNNKYMATQKNIENLLLALSRIDVLSPVSKIEKEQVASILRADGVAIEVFKNNRSLKNYFVSKPEMNNEKTYMMMLKSSEPFIVQIPSFKGLVARFFIVDENYWRNKTVFDYLPQNIKEIEVNYPEYPSKSFRAMNYNDGTFAIQKLSDNSYLGDFNVDKLARYFTYFQRIVFDDVVRDLNQSTIDSVLHSNPFCIITVEDIKGSINKISVYRKPSQNKFDEFGQKANFDYDRAYASFNDNKDLIIIQYYIFDPLFKEIDYFR
ncbi:MAG TPA: hypothetical protein DCG75_17085 [Bacteroidales bacterium]|nr:hypothetical protein [Bacteroidales bacterium]